MSAYDSLNDAQVRVLRWIRDGCPDGVFTSGYSHRLSARVLANRGLVKISGHGPTWTAELTEAGRGWEPQTGSQPRASAFTLLGTVTSRTTEPASDTVSDEPTLTAESLLAQVLAASGELALEPDADIDAYRAAARASLKLPERPLGKRLEVASVGDWRTRRFAVRLTDYFEDLVETVPVDVPDAIGRFHPAVRKYRDTRDWQYVSRDHVARACRVLQAIAKEAERRGWSVSEGRALDDGDSYVKRGSDPGHLKLTTDKDESYSIRIYEEAGRGAQRLDWHARSAQRSPAWVLRRQYEFLPTGLLGLDVEGLRSVSGVGPLRDTKRRKVEGELPALFCGIEVEDMYRARQRDLAEQERIAKKARWEEAMDLAKQRYTDDQVWRRASEQASELREVELVREYLDAVSRALSEGAVESPEGILEALVRLRGLADSRDPLRNIGALAAEVPEPRGEDLKPFLGGLSPYGP